jgi:hypothetical protein
VCSNTDGSYTCSCPTGYDGDPYTICNPIDHCSRGTDTCDTHATCTYTGPGTYTCTCNTGYDGDGFTCNPIDHCARGTDACDVNATCTYTGPGTYTCTCNSGYTGDGFTCTPISTGGIIEDFETGTWPWSPWVVRLSGGTVSTAYAHDGSRGIRDPDWHYRTDVTFGSTVGQKLSWWVMPNSSGRAYLGFASSSSGTRSFVVATNYSTLICQNNSSYGYADINTVSQSYVYGTWYRAEVEYNGGGTYTGRLYAADGTTLLNSLVCNYGSALPGGVAIRSFGSFNLDTVEEM